MYIWVKKNSKRNVLKIKIKTVQFSHITPLRCFLDRTRSRDNFEISI